MDTGTRTEPLYQLNEPSGLRAHGVVRWLAGAALYVATILWVVPRVAEPLVPLPAIPLAHALSLAVVTAVTSVILWLEARRTRSRGYGILGGVFSSAMVVLLAFTLAFPGSLRPPAPDGTPQQVLGGASTAVALFLLWHLLITVGVPVAAVVQRRDARSGGLVRPHGILPGVLSGILPAMAVCAWWLLVPDAVPPLIEGVGLTDLGTSVVWATCALAILGIVVSWIATKGASALSRWLLAICVLNLGDAILNLGAERYSLGWYAGRALGFVCLSALLVVLVVELGRIDTRMDRAATTDALTGLHNRMSFSADLDRELDRARRESREVALLLIDLDGFKAINDEAGHATGDAVLVEAGRRLSHHVRSHDLLVRMGGDEFVVVLVGLEQVADAEAAARRIVESLNRPVVLRGRAWPMAASVGLAVFPTMAQDAEDLLRCADRAMYLAKRSGGGQYRVCESAPS